MLRSLCCLSAHVSDSCRRRACLSLDASAGQDPARARMGPEHLDLAVHSKAQGSYNQAKTVLAYNPTKTWPTLLKGLLAGL